jgi:hypothetical protein
MALLNDTGSHRMSFQVNDISSGREKPMSKKKSDFNRGISRKCTRGNSGHPEAQTDMATTFPNTTSGRKTLCLVQLGETPTFDDAIDRVRAHPHLDPVRKRDLVSALRRVAAACDVPPSQLLADPNWLRQRLATVPVLRLGNSPKTRANVLSNAVAALEHAGMGAARRPKTNRSARWQRLWDPLTPSAKIALGSFTKFCSFHRIEPDQVTDQVVADYCKAIASP